MSAVHDSKKGECPRRPDPKPFFQWFADVFMSLSIVFAAEQMELQNFVSGCSLWVHETCACLVLVRSRLGSKVGELHLACGVETETDNG